MVCVLKSNTVFNLTATHTPISMQSCNSIGLRVQLVYFYLHLYNWCTFIYFYLHLYGWCTFIYLFTAGVLLSTSLQLVYFYLLLYSWYNFIYLLIKAHVIGTHLNCLDKMKCVAIQMNTNKISFLERKSEKKLGGYLSTSYSSNVEKPKWIVW